jgi:hypothetical protein
MAKMNHHLTQQNIKMEVNSKMSSIKLQDDYSLLNASAGIGNSELKPY